jgi:hypothetical protein
MVEKEPKTQELRGQAATVLSQARAELTDIRRAISQASGNSAVQSRLAAAGAQIAGVAAEVSQALNSSSFSLGAADLMALQSAVSSADLSALVDDASTPGGSRRSIAEIAAASAATRQEVQDLSRDVFDRHIFEPYLRFSSADDEAGFRARTAATQNYVKAQLDRGTAEGNLNAGGGMMDYMLNAHAHGAGKSPEFMPHWNRLAEDTERQRGAMHAAGQSTDEFDRNLKASVRRFLKAKGLSDAEIDEQLAKSASPQDAVNPFLHSGSDRGNLEHQVQRASPPAASFQGVSRVGATDGGATREGQLTLDFGAMEAKLRAAGLQPVAHHETETGHGLTIQKPVKKAGPGLADN